jgi:hypothetical protein
LNLGQYQKGSYSKHSLPVLTDENNRFNRLPNPGSFFIGEANCIVAELEDGASSLEDWRKSADIVIEKWLPTGKLDEASDCCLEHGYFAYVEGVKHVTFVLLLPCGRSKRISPVLYSLLPKLALIYLKFHAIERGYDKILHPDLEKQVGELKVLLETMLARNHASNAPSPDKKAKMRAFVLGSDALTTLEHQASTLSKNRIELMLAIEPIESYLQTLRVNIRNLEVARLSSGWGAQPPQVLPKLGQLTLLIEQMESDLHYAIITQRNAETASEEVQTLASTWNTRSQRWLSMALAFFSVMSVAQLFPEPIWGESSDPNAAWKAKVTALAFLAIVAGYMFIQRLQQRQREENKIS